MSKKRDVSARQKAGKCLIGGFGEIYLSEEKTEGKPILKFMQSHQPGG